MSELASNATSIDWSSFDAAMDLTASSCYSEASAWLLSQATATITSTARDVLTFSGSGSGNTIYETVKETLLATAYTPPAECCYGCQIVATSARLIYWSPEMTRANASITPVSSTPYTLVSDGFTLYVHARKSTLIPC
jgi:hypothetical protein